MLSHDQKKIQSHFIPFPSISSPSIIGLNWLFTSESFLHLFFSENCLVFLFCLFLIYFLRDVFNGIANINFVRTVGFDDCRESQRGQIREQCMSKLSGPKAPMLLSKAENIQTEQHKYTNIRTQRA